MSDARHGPPCNLKCKPRDYGRLVSYPLPNRLKVGKPKKMRTRKVASQLATVQDSQTRTGQRLRAVFPNVPLQNSFRKCKTRQTS